MSIYTAVLSLTFFKSLFDDKLYISLIFSLDFFKSALTDPNIVNL